MKKVMKYCLILLVSLVGNSNICSEKVKLKLKLNTDKIESSIVLESKIRQPNDFKIFISNEASSFVFCIYMHNGADWIIKSFQSIIAQAYPYFRIICINDISDNNVLQLIEEFVKENSLQDRVTIINNKSYSGKLESIYSLINVCKDEEILVLLDDNCYLLHEHALDTFAEAYSSLDTWLTFGSCSVEPKGFNTIRPGLSLGKLEKNTSFRKCCFFPPPYSFYVRLLRQVDLSKILDKKLDEKIYQNAAEYFLLWKLLEIASGHIKYIQDALCEVKWKPAEWLNKDFFVRCACNNQI